MGHTRNLQKHGAGRRHGHTDIGMGIGVGTPAASGAGAHSAPETPGVVIDHEGSYDVFVAFFFAGRHNRVYTRLAELSGARPGDRALDVGCGSGYLTTRMAALVGPTGTATGLDPAVTVIAHAQDAAIAAGRTALRFEVGVAEALDAADGTYDVVVSSLMLHHLPEELQSQALREMSRVLKPDGKLLIGEFRPPSGRVARGVLRKILGSRMADLEIDRVEPAIRAAGFTGTVSGDLHPWIRYVTARKPADAG